MDLNSPRDVEEDSCSEHETDSVVTGKKMDSSTGCSSKSQSKTDKNSEDCDEKMDEDDDVEVTEPRKRRVRRPNKLLDHLAIRDDHPQNSHRSIKPQLVYNSGRRIRRKTKYDEYFLTPLVRKKRQGGLPPEVPKVKLKRGRPPFKKMAALAAEAAKQASLASDTGKLSSSNRPSVNNSMAKSKKLFQTVIEEVEPIKSKASAMKSQCYICCNFACVTSDETFACSLCLNIAHKECVDGEQFYKELKKWRCSECLITNPAICSSCDEEYKKADGIMLMCDYCEEFFHPKCHTPPVTSNIDNTSPWRCYLCPNLSITDTLIGGREDLKSFIGTFAFSSSSTKSLIETYRASARVVSHSNSDRISAPPVDNKNTPSKQHPSPTFDQTVIKTEPPDDYEQTQNNCDKVKHVMEPASYKFHRPNEPIPEVDDWTAKQVADYFSERFGAIVGNAFLTQEIDGKSLKLMSREDVTDQLGLHFGIALKVLYYVRKIQLNTNVIHKLWS